MKKFVSLLLTAVLLATTLTVFAVPASAEAQTIPGSNTNITWELTENDTKLIIGGEGEMPDFMFRDKTPWYDVADEITAIEINSGVTSIGNNAFNQCTSLKELTIPGSVVSIGNSAFQGCASLQTVTIPGSVVSIGESAFANCGQLTAVTIPGSVVSIGGLAFADCTGIATLTISEGVKSIGTEAFRGCDKIANVTIPGTVGSIGEGAFYVCGGITTLTISDGVQSIGVNAFRECERIANVTIPGSVESIGKGAFSNCNSNLVINGPYSSAAEKYARENSVAFKGEGTCSHLYCFVCDSCHKSLTKSDLLQIWNSNGATASTLSEGNMTIICTVAAAVVFGLGGFFLGTKKKENEQSNA